MIAVTYRVALARLLGLSASRIAAKARSVVEMDRVAAFEWERLWRGWLRHESRFGAPSKARKAA